VLGAGVGGQVVRFGAQLKGNMEEERGGRGVTSQVNENGAL